MDLQNPRGIDSEDDLTKAITAALQPKSNRWDITRRLLLFPIRKAPTTNVTKVIRFDEAEVSRFIKSRPRHEHYLKLDRYHYNDSVALLGDAAHGMYSFLGQGAACGFQNAVALATSLQQGSDMACALQTYSSAAVPEGHAATDMNLVVHTIFGGSVLGKILAFPLVLLGAVRGRLIFKQLNENISYRQILRENNLLIWVSSIFWRKTRIPFVYKRKTA